MCNNQGMNQSQVKSNTQILFVLWAALFASQFLYVAAFFVMPQRSTDLNPDQFHKVVTLLTVCGVVSFVAGIFLPRMILRGEVAKIRALNAGSGESTSSLSQILLAPFLIRLACFESICIVGFVAGFITKKPEIFAPFLAASMVLFGLNFPSRGYLEKFIGR